MHLIQWIRVSLPLCLKPKINFLRVCLGLGDAKSFDTLSKLDNIHALAHFLFNEQLRLSKRNLSLLAIEKKISLPFEKMKSTIKKSAD